MASTSMLQNAGRPRSLCAASISHFMPPCIMISNSGRQDSGKRVLASSRRFQLACVQISQNLQVRGAAVLLEHAVMHSKPHELRNCKAAAASKLYQRSTAFVAFAPCCTLCVARPCIFVQQCNSLCTYAQCVHASVQLDTQIILEATVFGFALYRLRVALCVAKLVVHQDVTA